MRRRHGRKWKILTVYTQDQQLVNWHCKLRVCLNLHASKCQCSMYQLTFHQLCIASIGDWDLEQALSFTMSYTHHSNITLESLVVMKVVTSQLTIDLQLAFTSRKMQPASREATISTICIGLQHSHNCSYWNVYIRVFHIGFFSWIKKQGVFSLSCWSTNYKKNWVSGKGECYLIGRYVHGNSYIFRG